MKNYKIILFPVSFSVLIISVLLIIAKLLSQNFYLKKQNDLLFSSFNQIVRKIGDLESEGIVKKRPSLKPRVVSLKKETKDLKPRLEGSKGNRGFLTKNSCSTYSTQDKTQ